MNKEQDEILKQLWVVYYDNPLYDDNGDPIEGGQHQVLARALIAVLSSIQLPESAEIAK